MLGGVVSSNHIHLFVAIPPSISVSKLVQYLKEASSKKIQEEFSELRKVYWGRHFWGRGFFCVSAGNVTDEMIKNYIDNHDDTEQVEDNFKLDASL